MSDVDQSIENENADISVADEHIVSDNESQGDEESQDLTPHTAQKVAGEGTKRTLEEDQDKNPKAAKKFCVFTLAGNRL